MTKVAVVQTNGYWSGHKQFVIVYDDSEKLENVLGKAGITYPNREVVKEYNVTADVVISKKARVKKIDF